MSEQSAVRLIRHTEESYGASFKADLFEQYKHYVESTERISERRVSANNYLLTVNAVLVTLNGLLSSNRVDSVSTILVPVAGILISLTWHEIITSYRDLNTAKFSVIHELERQMPAALYEYEWKKLEKGRGSKYHPMTHLERWVPFVFAILYAFLFIVACVRMAA